MVISIPNSQFDSIHHIFDTYQYIRNVIEAIPKLSVGELWIDNPNEPTIALFTLPGVHILAGLPVPDIVNEILAKIPPTQTIFIPTQDLFWIQTLKRYYESRLGSYNRYSMSASSLTLEHIYNLKQDLPEGYKIQQVDNEVLNETKDSIGSYILLFFGSPERFLNSGKGFCIRRNNTTISIASSLVPFSKSLEIQVDTLEAYQRRGLATQVAVKLIEYCLKRGIEPHWDSDTETSRDFALKLGYSNPQAYHCYYWVK